jgi:hypothetical protein
MTVKKPAAPVDRKALKRAKLAAALKANIKRRKDAAKLTRRPPEAVED